MLRSSFGATLVVVLACSAITVEATFWWKPWHHFGEHIPVDYTPPEASAAVAVVIAPLEDTAATAEDTATTKDDAEVKNYDAFKAYVDSNPRLTLLSQALDAERTEEESQALQALINDQKDGCTLLAPTNSAMRWFGLTERVTMPTLVAEENAKSFKMLIDMHVIENETKLIPQLKNGEELPTAAGQNLRVLKTRPGGFADRIFPSRGREIVQFVPPSNKPAARPVEDNIRVGKCALHLVDRVLVPDTWSVEGSAGRPGNGPGGRRLV